AMSAAPACSDLSIWENLLVEKPHRPPAPAGEAFCRTCIRCCQQHARTHEAGRAERRMDHSKITTLVVAIIIGLIALGGLIGLGLTAHKGIFALIKARQA